MAERKLYPSEQQDRFIVRLPNGMRDKIGVAARANKRSMNAEIVQRLEASFSSAGEPLLVVNQDTAEAFPKEAIKAILETRDMVSKMHRAQIAPSPAPFPFKPNKKT
jgi:Arc-like DNA binding domain